MQFQLFNRRLKIAADDMALKYLIILTFRSIWFLSVIAASIDCYTLTISILIFIFGLNFGNEVLILYFSLQGTIANPKPRKILEYFVPLEIALRTIEILWLAVVLYDIFKPENTCASLNSLRVGAIGATFHCLAFFSTFIFLYQNSSSITETVEDVKMKRREIWEDWISNLLPRIKKDHRKKSILREATSVVMEWFPHTWAPSDFIVSMWLLTKEQLVMRHLDELDRYPVKNHRLDTGLAYVHFVNMRKVSRPLLHKLAFRLEGKQVEMVERLRVATPDIMSERVSVISPDKGSLVDFGSFRNNSSSTLDVPQIICHAVDSEVQEMPKVQERRSGTSLILEREQEGSKIQQNEQVQETEVKGQHTEHLSIEVMSETKSTNQGSEFEFKPPNTIQKHEIADLIHFAKYAKLAYKTRSSPLLEQYELVHSSDENDVFYCPFLVLLDHDWKSIVVSVRGSYSLEDALVDIKLTDSALDSELGDEYRVHSGYLTTALNMIDSVVQLVDKVYDTLDFKEYRIVCTGHSLGGAISSLLCYFLRKRGYTNSICFGYAMPVVANDNVAQLFEEFCVSVVCGHDIVSRLSYQSWYFFTKDVERILKEADIPKYKVVPSMILNAVLHHQYSTTGWLWADKNPKVFEDDAIFEPRVIPQRLLHTPSSVPGKVLYIEKIRDFANNFVDAKVQSRIEKIKDGLKHLIRRWVLNQGSKRAIRFVYVPRWATRNELKELVFSRTTLSDHTDCCDFIQDCAETDQLHTVKFR